MLAYFVVVFSLIGVGIFKLLSMKSDLPPGLPLGFDEKPKPGMRLVQKLKELIRKIIRDKVRIFTLKCHSETLVVGTVHPNAIEIANSYLNNVRYVGVSEWHLTVSTRFVP